jgi:hypothetical protein
MSNTATKKSLLQQIADLEQSVRGMGEPKKLQIHEEHHVPMTHMYSRRGSTDLQMMDDIRHHLKRSMAHKLADELIRSGAVKFTETLEEDHLRFGHSVRIKAELLVC